MFGRFEYITDLQYKIKSLEAQVDGFRSGEKFRRMHLEFQKQLAEKNREIRELKHELAASRCRTVYGTQILAAGDRCLEKKTAGELRKKEPRHQGNGERALGQKGGRRTQTS
jgi:hypothetical protein